MAQENRGPGIYINEQYIHKEGGKYRTIFTGKLKLPVSECYTAKDIGSACHTGKWVDCVVYQPDEPGVPFETYVRTQEEFLEKFTVNLPDDHHKTKWIDSKPLGKDCLNYLTEGCDEVCPDCKTDDDE